MTPITTTLVLAMAQPNQSQSIWVSLMPFALMIGIFYVLVLLPMRRRQKKVQEFLSALKVGDRVITSGGLFGSITRVGDKSLQLQVADKVRVEVSRAAIIGYQGQDPVVPEGQGQ